MERGLVEGGQDLIEAAGDDVAHLRMGQDVEIVAPDASEHAVGHEGESSPASTRAAICGLAGASSAPPKRVGRFLALVAMRVRTKAVHSTLTPMSVPASSAARVSVSEITAGRRHCRHKMQPVPLGRPWTRC